MDEAERIAPERFDLVFVDFDHTLFGANSTDLFIGYARPRWLAALLNIIFRKIVPWRWLVDPRLAGRLKDYACVHAITMVMPWTLSAWQKKAPVLFQQNRCWMVELLLSRSASSKITIISFGFAPIIRALIARSRWADCALIATPHFASLSDLRKLKVELATQHFSREAIASAYFITDSDDDWDLLSSVKHGVKIPAVRCITVRRSREVYLPLKYTALVKYGISYVLDQLVFVDFCLWLLAVHAAVKMTVLSTLAVAFLLLSLFCVYEIGYYENDAEADKERQPVLTGRERKYGEYSIRSHAWLWAAASMILAECSLALQGALHGPDSIRISAVWMLSLLSLRMLFKLYNHLAVEHRVYVYPCLQTVKYFSVLAFFPASTMGACLLLAQVLVMSINYLGYRLVGRRHFIDREKWRVFIFALLFALVFPFQESLALSSAVIAISAWLLIRASKPYLLALLRTRRTIRIN